jgi:hypothetical protein
VDRDLRFSGPLPGNLFDTGVVGLRPTQGNEKRLLFRAPLSPGSAPSPLSSRPERSGAERSAVPRTLLGNVFKRGGTGFDPGTKNGFCSATTLPGSAPSPLSSRPERSGVERSAVPRTLLGNVFQQSAARWGFFPLNQNCSLWRTQRPVPG